MTKRIAAWTRTRTGVPEWAIRSFPQPHIIAEVPAECGCSWTYSPDITGIPEYPFIIKVPWRMCSQHRKEYFRE